MKHQTRILFGFAAALLSTTTFSGICRAENPFAQWVTIGPRKVFSHTPALSPSGELHASVSVDFDVAINPDRPELGPLEVFTDALVKFDRQGRLVSTNRFVGVTSEHSAFDAGGNRYLTGNFDTNGVFSGSITSTNYLFDPAEVHGFFIAKYSPDDELLWVRSQALADEPTLSTHGSAIAEDAEGNIIVGGVSQGPITLGNVQFGQGGGPLLCKYDRDGQLLWAKRVDHQSFVQFPGARLYDLSVDPAGNIVICGFLSEGTADFGGTTVFPGSTGLGYGGDFFIARFKPNGDLHWVQLGYAISVRADKKGDIYAAFLWTKDVVGSGLAKLSSNGDLLWSKTFSGEVYMQRGKNLALDPNDEPVFTGEYLSTAQFGGITLPFTPFPGTFYANFFLAKADAQGNIQWAMSGRYGGGESVLCDPQGNIFLTGYAWNSLGSFGGLPLVPSGGGQINSFAAKLNPAPLLKIASSGTGTTVAWPARATNYVLEATTSLAPGSAWTPVLTLPTTVGTQSTVPVNTTTPAQFFRLHKP